MENLEDLKIMWKDINLRLSHLENENKMLIQNIKKTNYKTTQDKLKRKYGNFILVEFVMICFMTLFFIFDPLINEKYRIITLVYWDMFFLLELGIDAYLLYQVKKIDIFNSSIKEVAARAAENWKLHKIAIAISLPIALGAVLLFALAVNVNKFIIAGMMVGGLIGLTIGIQQLLRFKNYYKLLQADD